MREKAGAPPGQVPGAGPRASVPSAARGQRPAGTGAWPPWRPLGRGLRALWGAGASLMGDDLLPSPLSKAGVLGLPGADAPAPRVHPAQPSHFSANYGQRRSLWKLGPPVLLVQV